MKLTLVALFATILLSACAPSASAPTAMPNPAPTTNAMMPDATPSPGSMMPQPTESAGAMMEPTPTADAMMQAAPTADAMMPSDKMMANAPAETMAGHVVSMSPKHGQLLDKKPDQITISFDTPLAPTSTITVMMDGKEIAVGKTTLGAKGLSMSVTLPATAGDGIYIVKYTACQSDQMCSQGQFAFQVDSMMGH